MASPAITPFALYIFLFFVDLVVSALKVSIHLRRNQWPYNVVPLDIQYHIEVLEYKCPTTDFPTTLQYIDIGHREK